MRILTPQRSGNSGNSSWVLDIAVGPGVPEATPELAAFPDLVASQIAACQTASPGPFPVVAVHQAAFLGAFPDPFRAHRPLVLVASAVVGDHDPFQATPACLHLPFVASGIVVPFAVGVSPGPFPVASYQVAYPVAFPAAFHPCQVALVPDLASYPAHLPWEADLQGHRLLPDLP